MQARRGACRRLSEACVRAGIPRYGWHAIRRWAGTEAGQLGITEAAIARFLGHSTTAVTRQYVWVDDPVLMQIGQRLAALTETDLHHDLHHAGKKLH